MNIDLENLETAIPAVVTKVNSDGTIDATPCIRKVLPNGVIDIDNPAILSVPVMELGGANFSFTFPVKKGDQVLLLAMSRSAAKWKATGDDDVVPKCCGGCSLNDFVAIQICLDSSKASAHFRVTDDGDIEVTPASGRKILLDSDVDITGDVTVEKGLKAYMEVSAMAQVPGTAVNLSSHTHTTAVGPTSPPTPGT